MSIGLTHQMSSPQQVIDLTRMAYERCGFKRLSELKRHRDAFMQMTWNEAYELLQEWGKLPVIDIMPGSSRAALRIYSDASDPF